MSSGICQQLRPSSVCVSASLIKAFTVHWQDHWVLQNVWMESNGPEDSLHMHRIIFICLFCTYSKTQFIATDKALFFIRKMLVSFLFLNKNICCGYSLEAPRWAASNEYPQHMFLSRNKKNIMWIPFLICSYGHFFAWCGPHNLIIMIMSTDQSSASGIIRKPVFILSIQRDRPEQTV